MLRIESRPPVKHAHYDQSRPSNNILNLNEVYSLPFVYYHCMYVMLYVGLCIPRHSCGVQKTTLGNWFSLFTSQVGHSTSLMFPRLLQKMTDVYWNFFRNPAGPTVYLTEARADCPASFRLHHPRRPLALAHLVLPPWPLAYMALTEWPA